MSIFFKLFNKQETQAPVPRSGHDRKAFVFQQLPEAAERIPPGASSCGNCFHKVEDRMMNRVAGVVLIVVSVVSLLLSA